MLSESSIRIIQSTVPVLQIHGTSITKRFYERLFERHPDLLNLFNQANQEQGSQQAALANAVYEAAKHIDRLDTILPVVRSVAHKHRSLGVLPEHYPLVGQNLIAAIKDVLGEAATDEILQAWTEAYGVIADTFIGVESEMYGAAKERHGGWQGYRAFAVARKVRESDVIASFYLAPRDGGDLPRFEPGQYLSLKAEIPGEAHTHIRQYSLSDAPGKAYYRISVKREDSAPGRPAGLVSNYLHEQIEEGSVVWISAPAGDFALDRADARPVVLLSGGVGITPLASMLNVLSESDPHRQVTFIHAARNGDSHALKEAVEELVRNHSNIAAFWCYSNPTDRDRASNAFHAEGYIDLSWLQSIVPDRNASYYYCGPLPFMRTVSRLLRKWEIPAADMHYEFFGPAARLSDAE
ncbi:NO-inducible flavohemoprotein [Cohnella nanjingensis]|uniref:Flavohemoprotein n=1 Tax=Cohnella nanjingensis TaxID=1387779 RepID=A0A7X0VI36_9BACL|nr:NO-inducible flavohemoprotein [Cohnella nanjingensis]MBB6674561.1 NO-inducible flavohemoprotein [Cohnella nanjingensis]